MNSNVKSNFKPLTMSALGAILLAMIIALATASPALADSLPKSQISGPKTIQVNKSYNGGGAKCYVYLYRFTSSGGNYKVIVNNKLSTSYLEILAHKDAKVNENTHFYLMEWPSKGKHTFNLGKIKKGTLVQLQFTIGKRGSNQKFSFKVAGKKSPASSSSSKSKSKSKSKSESKTSTKKRIYALVYGGAKGKDPSSSTNTKIITRAFKNLKIPRL